MPGRRHLIISLLVLAALTPSARAIELRDYFPTPNGAIWTYAFSDWSAEGRCSGQRSISVAVTSQGRLELLTTAPQVECSKPAAQARIVETTETFVTDALGHHLLARDESIHAAPQRHEWVPALLVLPLRANIYQAFQSSGFLSQRDGGATQEATFQATLRVMGVERVLVPAGSFAAALHLQLIETRSYPAPFTATVEVRTDRWLGREVGALRIKTEVWVNGKVTRSTQLQLACSTLTDLQSTRCPVHEAQ